MAAEARPAQLPARSLAFSPNGDEFGVQDEKKQERVLQSGDIDAQVARSMAAKQFAEDCHVFGCSL